MKITKQTTFAAMALPHDIIFHEILASVPAKSLVRFRCVSKHWHKAMADRHFATTHLRRLKSHPPGHIIHPFDSDYSFSNQQTGELFDLRLKNILNSNNYLLPVTSCDGLLVIQSVDLSNFHDSPCYYVCNPIIGQYVKLPPAPYLLNPCEIVYDSNIQRYKVISWSRVKGCAIFTLGDAKGSWRLVGFPEGSGEIYARPVLVNGALNWVCDGSEKASILSLNIAKETIFEIEMSMLDAKPILVEMNGSLHAAFLCGEHLDETTIWIMDDWGKHKWTKLCKCARFDCSYSVVRDVAVHSRSRLQNGLQPVFDETKGFTYCIEHVNSMVSWDGTAFGKNKLARK